MDTIEIIDDNDTVIAILTTDGLSTILSFPGKSLFLVKEETNDKGEKVNVYKIKSIPSDILGFVIGD